ncbi:hypothetical protein [Sphingobacterium kitahiroshimense]|uniref:Bacterial surface antigen (D15) domain-containing protein n=1 Tax=Sphingobacterium kitahiroshimense TaxID=470446 RepID=A0ABV0BWM1_9SPHI
MNNQNLHLKKHIYSIVSTLLFITNVSHVCGQSSFKMEGDSAVAMIDPTYDQVSKLHRFWLGDSYRELYNTPVKMRVMHLQKELGGLTVVKLGGGMQTQSLRLRDSTGREWVLRSINKFPERSLPEHLRNTIAKDIVQDQISIAHPFGALTVPTFNRVLKIPHASPELVFVGDDPGLEEHRAVFKNRAYMFEPRVPLEDEDAKTDNTLKAQRKLEEDNDIQVDQRLTLRARLLDFILGDWDRHEDNWRWDSKKIDDKKVYSPVPRDRDKVYYKTSGILPVLLSMQWLKAHLQPFGDHIRNVGQWNFNERHFDRYFLNHLDRKDWKEEIKFVQTVVNDAVIDEAIAQMPDTIVRLGGEQLKGHIRARRDNLMSTALDYYGDLAKNVDIATSAKNEFFYFNYHTDGSLELEIRNKKKDGSEGRKLVKRTFLPKETKELRIYGLDGSDVYDIRGQNKSKIKLRLIGGKGKDDYRIDPNFENGKLVYIYDDKEVQPNFKNTPFINLKLSNDTLVHRYDRNSFKYDRTGVLASLQYGVDKGLLFGAGYLIEKQGFRKEPYAFKQEFWAHYTTGRKSFSFKYNADIKSIWNKNDLLIQLESDGPKNQENFFGLGNNTDYEQRKERGIQYYRNRYDVIYANFLLKREFAENWKWKMGSSSEFIMSHEEANEGHFFEKYAAENPAIPVFGKFFFTGILGSVQYDSRDQKDNAKKGIFWDNLIEAKSQLNSNDNQFIRLRSIFNFYKTNESDWITLANRTGFETLIGDPLIFQYAHLGGENSLRGFNSKRLSGQTMLYNNFELRFKVFSYDSYLVPGTVGLIGFHDVGRVWMKNESSSRWHMGYGGGFYFIPADLLVIQAVGGFSKEGFRPYLSIGLRF